MATGLVNASHDIDHPSYFERLPKEIHRKQISKYLSISDIKNICLVNRNINEYYKEGTFRFRKDVFISIKKDRYFYEIMENQSSIKELFEVFPLRFDLDSSYNIMDNDLKYVHSARELSLFRCENVTNEGLKYLINVQFLNLAFCLNITDDGLACFQNLIALDLSNTNVTGKGFAYLGDLVYLNLSSCLNIEDDAFHNLSSVRFIDVSGTNITGESLANIKNLRFIKIVNCPNITQKAINSIRSNHQITVFNKHLLLHDVLKSSGLCFFVRSLRLYSYS